MVQVTNEAVRFSQVVNGEHVSALNGEEFSRTSPFDGRPVSTYPNSREPDAERAIDAARMAFDETTWGTGAARNRARVLAKASDTILDRVDEFARWIALEAGKPIGLARSEVVHSAQVLAYYAAKANDLRGESITQQIPDAIGLVVHEPVGVVGIITPWNFPLSLVVRKVAPALAAGCTIVAKPSHYTPAATLMLAEVLAESGLPAGVFNVVTSDIDNGALVGQCLSASERVDMVAFTGSTEAGKAVMRAAAGNVKKVALELGGKSPNIILPDAPLEAAVAGAFNGIYMNSGQVCQAGTRLFVADGVKDEVVDRLVQQSKDLVMGDPLDSATRMGPLVNERQLARVEDYLERGRNEARLLTGGGRPSAEHLAAGNFVEPTIFDNVDPGSSIAREEIFGPVLSVLSFDGIDDVITKANDTMYGLAAAVWTNDINAAFKVAKGIRAGTVWVNSFHASGLNNMPYGGYKQSGLGRELGDEGLGEYLETKAIQIKLH